MLGNQVVLEIGGTAPNTGQMVRGYVYLGGQMLAIQQGGQVSWVHQDPVTKSQRLTDKNGDVVSTIDLDPWGGETRRSEFQSLQPHRYTTYERDANGGDEAMFRRYESKLSKFAQPDPYDGSYNLNNPQSFNRYAYVQNDPVNSVDPSGLMGQCYLSGIIHVPDTNGLNYYIWTCNSAGDDFTGIRDPRGGGGGGDRPPQQKPDYNNCYQFVDYLVGLVKNLTHGGSSNSAIKGVNDALARDVGARMTHEAYKYKYAKWGYEGFKDKLTMGHHGSGVYGHILFQAGAMLSESSALQMAAGWAALYDKLQTNPYFSLGMRYPHNQTDQRPAENEGNNAGVRVGMLMSLFLKLHKDPKMLKEQLESEL